MLQTIQRWSGLRALCQNNPYNITAQRDICILPNLGHLLVIVIGVIFEDMNN